MEEKLRLRWEIIIDDIVQHGYVYASSSHISNQKCTDFTMQEQAQVYLPSGLIKSTVYVGAGNALHVKQLRG